jgi:hypothetical protein
MPLLTPRQLPWKLRATFRVFDIAGNGDVVAIINGSLFEHTTPLTTLGWNSLNTLSPMDPAGWLEQTLQPVYQAMMVVDSSGPNLPVEFSIQFSGTILNRTIFYD